jgi:hypothetical protein
MKKRGRPPKIKEEQLEVATQQLESSSEESEDVVEVVRFVGFHPVTGVMLFEQLGKT